MLNGQVWGNCVNNTILKSTWYLNHFMYLLKYISELQLIYFIKDTYNLHNKLILMTNFY